MKHRKKQFQTFAQNVEINKAKPSPHSAGTKVWLPGLLLMALVFIAYQPALRGGFIWDDDTHISTNNALRSARGLWEIWFQPGATCQYYPLSFTLFWVGYHLWGLNPLGYHLLTLLFHGLASVLLWQVLKRLEVRAAWLAGAIFALHPVNVMSAAWMTELKNTLAGTLILGAAWAYLRFASLGVYKTTAPGGTDWRYALGSLMLFQLAMFAKTAVSFFPATMLLLIWWKGGRIVWRVAWPLLAMLAIAAGMGLLTLHIEHLHGATGEEFRLGLLERALVSGRSFWFYLGKLFFPYQLAFCYERWKVDAGVWWQYLYPVATIGMLGGLWRLRRHTGRGPLVVMLHFYIATSLLVLIQVLYMMRYTFVSDHWQYFGCMSVFAAAAAGIDLAFGLVKRGGQPLKWACCGTLLLVLGLLTRQQCKMYADLETLWRTNLARVPNSYMAHESLGSVLFLKGQVDEAMVHLRTALEFQPDYAEAHYNLAVALDQKRQMDEAGAQYQKTLEIEPGHAQAQNNLGIILFQKGQVDEAVAHFQKAVAIQPDNAEFQCDLGQAFFLKGEPRSAVEHYQRVLELQPQNVIAGKNLAWILATCPEDSVRNGRRAVELAEQAVRQSGGTNPVFFVTLAAAYAEAGRFSDAVTTARRAVQLAASQNNDALVAAVQAQLKLYLAGSPFRDAGTLR